MNAENVTNRQNGHVYNNRDQIQTITRPNGTVRSIDYDDAGQPNGITEKTSGNVPIAYFRLNWDNAGRTEWEYAAPVPHYNPVPTRNMTYDDDNRLATYNGQQVVCDPDGNMTYGPMATNTFGTYVYDARNRLQSAGGLTYGYDPLANRTSVANGASVTRYVVNPNAALSQVFVRVKNGAALQHCSNAQHDLQK
jgi:YD repeat-containing protein